MSKITTILFTILFSSAAIAAHSSGHTVVVPKKAVDLKNWKPPLEIQNKAGNAVVPAPVKK